MLDTFFQIVAEWAGAGLAVLFLGFILGIIYTQRRCASVQKRCQELRDANRVDVFSRIAEVKGSAGIEIGHHVESCPNSKLIATNSAQIATVNVKHDTEITNIHHRLSEIKESIRSTETKVSEELRDQRKFLNDLATKIINGTKKGG